MMKNTTLYLLIIFLLPLVGFAQAPIGNNLYYNGINEYVDAGQKDVFRPKHITIEMWVRPIRINDTEEFIRNLKDSQFSGNHKGYVFTYNNEKLRLVVGGRTNNWTGGDKAAIDITTDIWQHVTATYDGKILKMYKNGVLEDFKDYGFNRDIDYGVVSQLSGLVMGGDGNKYMTEGRLDEVRIWNRALTGDEISKIWDKEITKSSSGKVKAIGGEVVSTIDYCKELIVYYNFNETSVSTPGHVTDYSCSPLNHADYVSMDDSNIGDKDSGRNFISVNDGNWEIADSWNHNLVPTDRSDNVIIRSEITVGSNTNMIHKATIDDGYELIISNGKMLNVDKIENNGKVVLKNNSEINLSNIIPSGSFNNVSKVVFNKNNRIDGNLINKSNIIVKSGVNLTITGNFKNLKNYNQQDWSDVKNYKILVEGNFINLGENFILGDEVSLEVSGKLENTGSLYLGAEGSATTSGSTFLVHGGVKNSSKIFLRQLCSLTTSDIDNTGEFVMESNAFGTASLLTSGNITNTGTFKVERWLDEGRTWHLFSSPMNKEVSMVLYGHLLNSYADGTFTSIKETDYKLVVGDGYVAKLKFALSDNKPNPIVFSKGAPNNGDFEYKLDQGSENTYFGLPAKFDLIGNPYPSNLDWKKIYNDNSKEIDATLYYYVDDGSEQGDKTNGWRTYNAVEDPDANEQFISIGQGFGVVRKNNGKPKTLSFKNSQRTHESGNGFNKKNNELSNYFEIVSSTSRYVDVSSFKFNENSTRNYDSDLDAYKLNSFADSPNTSFISDDNVKLSTCEMPETESVDLGFSMTTSDKVTFSVDNVYDFTAIILEDKENGVRTDLMKDDYTFSYSIDDDQQGRFTIHFKKDVLSDDLKELDGMLVYSTNSEVTINTPSELNDVNVGIYDMNGQLMLLKQYSNLKEETIETNLYEGIYILKIDSQEGTFSSKLRLQN